MKLLSRKKKHVVITGASGFVGYHLAKRLLATTDYYVTLIIRDFNKELAELVMPYADRAQFMYADLVDEFAFQSSTKFPAPDVVYHLAAKKAVKGQEFGIEEMGENTAMTYELFNCFGSDKKGKGPKIIYISTCEVWGALSNANFQKFSVSAQGLVGIDPMDKRWLYALSKIIDEQFIIHGEHNNPWTIVRLQNPYGPRMGSDALIPKVCNTLIGADMTKPVKLPLTGYWDSRPFTYIDDVVDGLLLAMDKRTNGKVMQLADSINTSAHHVAAMLGGIAGRSVEVIDESDRNTISTEFRFVNSEDMRELGWEPKVSLSEGLARTYAWYAEKHGA